MQAGRLLLQISQRTLVTKTCLERMWSAKDAGGILAGRANSQLNSSAPASSPLHLFGFLLTFHEKGRADKWKPGLMKVSALLTNLGCL